MSKKMDENNKSNKEGKEELSNQIGDTNKKMEENSKKMEETLSKKMEENSKKMEEKMNELKNDNKSTDVYKRQDCNVVGSGFPPNGCTY